MARGDRVRGLLLVAEQEVVVGDESFRLRDDDRLLARIRLHGVRRHVHRLVFLLAAAHREADVHILDPIRAVVLRLHAECAGLQHHVQILRDEDDGALLPVRDSARGGEDAVIRQSEVGEEIAQRLEARRVAHELPAFSAEACGGIDAHAQQAAILQLHARLHVARVHEALA